MSLIYVTGITGSGKSAVCGELARRGFDAHDADLALNAFYHNQTGEKIDRRVPVSERTPEWRKQYSWNMSLEKLKNFKDRAEHKPVFICGVAANDDEYLEMFDKVFALVIDADTLRYRLTTRTSGDYGKSEHEMQEVLKWQKYAEADYRNRGAYIIDATKPLDEVVDKILANI